MKRGDIWTVSGGTKYTGKPRPAVVVQDDTFDATASVTVCPFTTDATDAQLIRPLVTPSNQNGLSKPSRVMVDKVSTVPRHNFGVGLGRLDDDEVARISVGLTRFLGLNPDAPVGSGHE